MRNVCKPLCIVVLLMTASLLTAGCGGEKKGSMDNETAQMLWRRYGDPVVIGLDKAGTQEKELKSKVTALSQVTYLRVYGLMDGSDFLFLNDSLHYSLLALDLLDAQLVPGEKVYYKPYGSDEGLTIQRADVLPASIFDGLPNLEQLYLPLGLTEIGDNAFDGSFFHLECVAIPPTVKRIGTDAFRGCSVLTSFSLPEGLTALGEGAIPSNSLPAVRIPASVTDIPERALNCYATDLYLSWTPEQLASLPKFKLSHMVDDENPPRGYTRFIMFEPTLHVPAEYVDAYKEAYPNSHVVADETGGQCLQPTFFMGTSHIGPVKKDLLFGYPRMVSGLYDSIEQTTETTADMDGEYESKVIYFKKDGTLMFKGYLSDDEKEFTTFVVYPAASCVKTHYALYAGCPVSMLSRMGSWLIWSEGFDAYHSCTDNTHWYNMENNDLNGDVDWASSYKDFREGATIAFISI